MFEEQFVVFSVRHNFYSFAVYPMEHFPVAALIDEIALLIVHEFSQLSVARYLSHTTPAGFYERLKDEFPINE